MDKPIEYSIIALSALAVREVCAVALQSLKSFSPKSKDQLVEKGIDAVIQMANQFATHTKLLENHLQRFQEMLVEVREIGKSQVRLETKVDRCPQGAPLPPPRIGRQ